MNSKSYLGIVPGPAGRPGGGLEWLTTDEIPLQYSVIELFVIQMDIVI